MEKAIMKYYIFKGCHYSTFIPTVHKAKPILLSKSFCFDKSCKYVIDEDSCVNKLFGFCFGLFGVHKNSIRFGWKYIAEEEKFFIYKYIYNNGKLTKSIIFDCKEDEYHTYSINMSKTLVGKYHISMIIDDKVLYEFDINKLYSKLLITLGFYFGGNTRAPHTMKIIEK